MSEPQLIESYARVLDAERRIWRIDRWVIPIPGGIPLTGLAWYLASAATIALAVQLPGGSLLVHAAGWPVLLVIAPLFVAMLMSRAGRDEQPAHQLLITGALWQQRLLVARWRTRRASTTTMATLVGPLELLVPARLVLRQQRCGHLAATAAAVAPVGERRMLCVAAGQRLRVAA